MSHATILVENRTITVDLVGPGGALALGAAEAAEASAAAAAASAIDSAASAAESAASAAAALLSEETAGTYLDGVEAAVAGIPLDATLPLQAVSRTILAGFTGMSAGRQAWLSEAGRGGVFIWSTADESANVTIDVGQGIYVPPTSDTTGASGAWVRRLGNEPWQAEWFGLPTATNDSPIMRAIEALRPDGTDVHFGEGTFIWSDVVVEKPGHWKGAGKGTVMQHGGTNRDGITSIFTTLGNPDTNAYGFIFNTTSGVRVSHMRFTNLYDQDNSGAAFPIFVAGLPGYSTTAGDPRDMEFDHLWFDNCDTGIRILYGGAPQDDPIWYTPERIHIHDCVFDDVRYQCIVPEGRDIFIERCKFIIATGLTRPQSFPLRALGFTRLTVRDCDFQMPRNSFAVVLQNAGNGGDLDHVGYRAPADLLFESNRLNECAIAIEHTSRRMVFRGNTLWADPSSASNPTIPAFQCSGQNVPVYFGQLEIEDNEIIGYSRPLSLVNFSVHTVAFKRNRVIGNKTTGSQGDVLPIYVKVTNGTNYHDGVTQVKPPILLEIEDNEIFINPSQTGAIVLLDDYMTGLYLSYAGNKIADRDYPAVVQLGYITIVGDPQTRVSKSTAFAALSTLTGLDADVVGDNVAMPAGFYDALMASSFFRPEQVEAPFPPTWP